MSEQRLIAAVMSSRDAYERVMPFMEDRDFSPPGQFWWKLIQEWYANDKDVDRVDSIALSDRGGLLARGKQRDVVLGFLRDAAGLPVSARNVSQIALELKRHNVGMELAAAIAKGTDSKKQLVLTQQFLQLLEATELTSRKKAVSYEVAPPVEDIFAVVGDHNRIPLAPFRLNSRIDGGALPATHILLFARPEMGKSTFAINFAVQLAKKDKRVLYISNEDSIYKLKQRALARGTGMTVREATADRQAEAVQLYKDRGLDERLTFVHLTDAGIQDIRRPVEEFEADVIVLDQIRNAGSGDADSMVRRLDENGQQFRELLGEYQAVGLSVAQAGAGSRVWLGMEDLADSKTGLPASADLMLGMGADDGMIARGQRALSIVKNKLSSESTAREGLQIEVDLARVRIQ